jgi:hypothetical protein
MRESDKNTADEMSIRSMVADRDKARAKMADGSGEVTVKSLMPDYIEQMRTHVNEGGQLSHRNGLDLLAEVERLQGLVPVYLGGTRGKTL